MSSASCSVPGPAKPAPSQGTQNPAMPVQLRACLCLPLGAWPKTLPKLKLSSVPSRSS